MQPAQPPAPFPSAYPGPQPSAPPSGPPKRRSQWPIIVAVIAVVAVLIAAAVLYYSPATSPSSQIRDSDGDGIPDAQDAFPSDRTQWADRDDDGHGDNPSGFSPDAFPDDPSEWRDADSDGVGDNADIYDSGNGGVRISVSYLAVAQDCDAFSPCDAFFGLSVDANSDGTYECSRTSPEYTDINILTNPSGASVLCDIPDGANSIRVTIEVYDADVFNPPEAIDYVPENTGAWYIYTIAAPFSESQSESGDGSNGYPAQITWSIQVAAA